MRCWVCVRMAKILEKTRQVQCPSTARKVWVKSTALGYSALLFCTLSRNVLLHPARAVRGWAGRIKAQYAPWEGEKKDEVTISFLTLRASAKMNALWLQPTLYFLWQLFLLLPTLSYATLRYNYSVVAIFSMYACKSPSHSGINPLFSLAVRFFRSHALVQLQRRNKLSFPSKSSWRSKNGILIPVQTAQIPTEMMMNKLTFIPILCWHLHKCITFAPIQDEITATKLAPIW